MLAGVFAKTFAATGALANLSAVRDAGFAAAQFNMACLGLPSLPETIPAEVARGVADGARATGIAISAVSGTYNMIHPDPAMRDAGLRLLGVLISRAREMGAGLVTLCTGSRDSADMWRDHPDNRSPEAWRDLRAQMVQAIELAETHGVDLGVEPELANVVNSAEAARRLIDEIGSPRLRIVLDPANLAEVVTTEERREIVARAIDVLGDRIAIAHAKDRDARGAFAAAGRGVIDFAHFIGSLRQAKFDGPLIAHGMSEAEAPGVAAFLRRAIDA